MSVVIYGYYIIITSLYFIIPTHFCALKVIFNRDSKLVTEFSCKVQGVNNFSY